ncbi:hypothetical protein WAF17_13810 [Bernardetia sp. ABR2-2B]|uniref:hypothetical protein n=1 Tax=Bernardetia sp. ABR2-2B TaxID=3127472 RepID=UPI0030CB671B
MKQLLLFFLFIISTTYSFGQNLVTYDFTAEPGNQPSTSPSTTATNMIASAINRGSGITATAALNTISSDDWATGAVDLNDYYELTLIPLGGFKLDLDNINFRERRSGTGIRDFEIRTSLDGYAASYFATNVPDNTSQRNHTFTFPAAFSNVTSSITIRIYGYNAEGTGGTWQLRNNTTTNNFSITGSVISTAPADISLIFDDTGDANIARESNDNVIFRAFAQVADADATLNQVTLRTTGSYSNTDIKANGFKLWYSTDNFLDAGDTQLSATGSVSGSGETIAFTGLSQLLPTSSFNFLFITVDIDAGAIINNTIQIGNTTIADFTFAAPSTKTGTANSGNLHTIVGLNTGTISNTSLCVTSTQGESIDVPFTYSPTGIYTGTFIAQLSDAAGSFVFPSSIGSVISDNTGNQTISATIPAGTPQGSNYRIRVVSSVPNVEGADNGADITVDLLTVSIAPTTTQNLSEFQNGDPLTANESHPIQSRRWKYSTVSGGPYTNFLGGDPTQRPYFETAGTYYMVVETLFDCGKSVISNEVQINVANFVGTRLFPGDMAIVGWDAVVGGARDEYAITNLVPLEQGTKFLITNATYENGSAANTRDNVWQNGLENVEFTYNGVADLPAGSIISFELSGLTGDDADNIRINGVNAGADITSVVGSAGANPNISSASPDQMYIMQGSFNSTGTDFDGYVLFGMTNNADWVDFVVNVSSARTSRLHPHIRCINTSHPTGEVGSYFDISNPALRNADQRTILGNIINMSNWVNLPNNADVLPAAVHTNSFTVTSPTIKTNWIGDEDENWFDCSNWSSLYVPDRYTNVEFTTTALGDSRINESADFSDEYEDIAEVKNIILENRVLQLIDDRAARLDVYENLTIQGTGYLDMDDDLGFILDGTINIRGNWINNIGTAAFEEGEGLVVFEGGNNQSITTVGGEESFYDVTLNCGRDLTINNETIIKREFLFQSGNVLAATSSPLTFDVDAFYTDASVNRHIRGASRRRSNKSENFIFPIGKNGIYRPAIVHIQSGGSQTIFFAEYFDVGYGTYEPVISPLVFVSQLEYWIINREVGTADAEVSLTWGPESLVTNPASLVVAHFTDEVVTPAGDEWVSRGQQSLGDGFLASDATHNNTTLTGGTAFSNQQGQVRSSQTITQFSPFTFGSIDDTNLLPVTWLSFNAKYNQEQENVFLEWATLSESKNKLFAIERSENGIDFEEIGIKKGALTTSSIKNYQFWDFEPLQTKAYYRIKQIDINGEFSYSNIKMIETKSNRRIGITNYENQTILYANLKEATKAKIKIYDMNGNTVGSFGLLLERGQNEILLPLTNISKAVYIYKIELENQSDFVSGKFIIK